MTRVAFALVLLLVPLLVFGQEAGPVEGTTAKATGPLAEFTSSDKEPIKLQADRMEADIGLGHLKFSGRVSAQQGERTIYADRVDVDFTDKGEVITLVAAGNVKMKQKDAFANCEQLKYDNPKQEIVMSGEPRVVQGKQMIMGKEITYYLKEERLVVLRPRIEWVPGGTKEKPAAETGEKETE